MGDWVVDVVVGVVVGGRRVVVWWLCGGGCGGGVVVVVEWLSLSGYGSFLWCASGFLRVTF